MGSDMKKTLLSIITISALSVAGCNEKPRIDTDALKENAKAGTLQASGGIPVQKLESQTNTANPVISGGDPYSYNKTRENIVTFKNSGKVIQTMNAGGYTYMQVADKKGQKIWLAVPETKVSVDDSIEFPDAPPIINFKSKTLNRDFDRITFIPTMRILNKQTN